MNKTLSILVLAFTLILSSCANKQLESGSNTFTVSGTIEGLDTEFMTRSYRDAEGNRTSDSIFVKDGYFSYTAQIEEPTHIIFWPNVERTIKRSGRGYYPAKSSQFAFLASPGDNIIFKGEVLDFINAYPSGSTGNESLSSINKRIFPLMNKAINLQLEINKLDESTQKEQLQNQMEAINDEVLSFKKSFVQDNTNSEAAAFYLSDMMIRSQVSQDEAISLFKTMDSSLSGYPFYKAVGKRVAGIEATQVGKIMPNFKTTATLNGEPFELEELRGKYVLMDFWGTWCGPCIAEMPTVKAYKEKYADKLVVIGVNNGDTMEKISEFVTPKGYDWRQIKDKYDNEDLVLRLNVAGFPTKFILSPEGEILHRFVGNTEIAFEALDELLSE